MTLLKNALIEFVNNPQHLLDFVNDESAADWLRLDANNERRSRLHHRAKNALKSISQSRTGREKQGNKAIEKLKEADISWMVNLGWNEGLFIKKDAYVKGLSAPAEENLEFAIALIADLCVDGRQLLVNCARCGQFALRSSRGGGGNPHRWCSTKCGTANAQKQKRIRDREQKKGEHSTSSSCITGH